MSSGLTTSGPKNSDNAATTSVAAIQSGAAEVVGLVELEHLFRLLGQGARLSRPY